MAAATIRVKKDRCDHWPPGVEHVLYMSQQFEQVDTVCWRIPLHRDMERMWPNCWQGLHVDLRSDVGLASDLQLPLQAHMLDDMDLIADGGLRGPEVPVRCRSLSPRAETCVRPGIVQLLTAMLPSVGWMRPSVPAAGLQKHRQAASPAEASVKGRRTQPSNPLCRDRMEDFMADGKYHAINSSDRVRTTQRLQ